MSNLTKKQRDALPESAFGDPKNRLFPILDQDDVDSAARLIGKAGNKAAVKARIIAIARRKGLKIPDAWQEKAAASASMSGGEEERVPVRFDLKASKRVVEGDYAVYPNALLWVADDYPDKQYAMTPEENWAAVENFKPVGGNIEHTDFLAGRACQVRSIYLDAQDPFQLRGVVSVPLALDNLLEPRERGLSCEWDRYTKLLGGMALTTNPRVPIAALMNNQEVAAYASSSSNGTTRHDTYEGQSVMQSMHDMASRSGAICDPENAGRRAYYVSGHESAGMQAMHDTAVEHGAKCSAVGNYSNYSAAFSLLFAGSRHSKGDMTAIQHIHDEASGLGAACGTSNASAGANPSAGSSNAPAGAGRKAAMSTRRGKLADRLKSFGFWHEAGEEFRAAAEAEGVEVPFTEDAFELAEMAAQEEARKAREEAVAEMKAQRDEAQRERDEARKEKLAAIAQRHQAEAAGFADALIQSGKLFPGEREPFIAAFAQAAQDDAASGPATFTNGNTGSRVDALKKVWEARPESKHLREQIDPRTGVRVIPSAEFADKRGDASAIAHAPTKEGEEVAPERAKFLLELAGIPTPPANGNGNGK